MDFLSGNKYVSLPPFASPRVILAVDTPAIAKNSLKLYRVYSKKAAILKKLVAFFAQTKLITLFAKKGSTSKFAEYIQEQEGIGGAGSQWVLSKYLATDKDKIILQVQSDAQIKGYIKYALNEKGKDKLKREIRGTAKLKELGIKTLNILSEGVYMGNPYFISEEVEEINTTDFSQLDFSFDILKKDISHPLAKHPRVLGLSNYFSQRDKHEYLTLLEDIVASSEREYAEAYEHGDFSPWNIFITKEEVWLFDLEFYEEKGLELFDLIAYYFRTATHLQGMDGQELREYIFQQIDLPEKEKNVIFKLFLLKEIMEIETFGRTHMVDIFDLLTK